LQDIEQQQQQKQQNGRTKLKKPLSICLERPFAVLVPGAVQLEALHCVVACMALLAIAGASTNNSMAACVVFASLHYSVIVTA
jgi:hypothetical protein